MAADMARAEKPAPFAILAASLAMQGWTPVSRFDPDCFRMGATLYHTLRRGPVRIALSSRTQLGECRGSVDLYDGTAHDIALLAVIADPDARMQGLGKKAITSFASAADTAGCHVWVEAARMEGATIPNQALRKLYLALGWAPLPNSLTLMKREPRPIGVTQ